MVATCIFYDCDEVPEVAITMARAQAKGDYLEAVRASAVWPETASGDRPLRLVDYRDSVYLDALMRWLDGLLASITTAIAPSGAFVRADVSLLEAARYALLYSLAPSEHRWRAICDLHEMYSPGQILWACGNPHSAANLALESLSAGPVGVTVIQVGTGRVTPPAAKCKARADAYRVKENLLDRLTWIEAKVLGGVRPRSSDGSRIVFTEYFPKNCRITHPVLLHLREKLGCDAVWLAARRSVVRQLRGMGETPLWLGQFGPLLSREGVVPEYERSSLREALRDLPSDIYCGTNSAGLANSDYLMPLVESEVLRCCEDAAVWVEDYDCAWSRLEPAVVVSTTYSSIPGRAAALTLRRRGGKAVYLQHGALPDNYCYSYFCHDRLLLWGERQVESLRAHGLPEGVAVAVGAPYELERAGLCPQLQMNPGRAAKSVGPRVAFMASRTGGAVSSEAVAKATVRAVRDAVLQIDGATLHVKAHPGDSRTEVLTEILGSDARVSFSQQGDAMECIAQSDVVIVVSSTTAYEACAADKPLIVFNLTGMPDFTEVVEMGAALRVSDSEDLHSAIEDALLDESTRSRMKAGRDKVVKRLLGGAGGGFCARVGTEVARLLPEAETFQ